MGCRVDSVELAPKLDVKAALTRVEDRVKLMILAPNSALGAPPLLRHILSEASCTRRIHPFHWPMGDRVPQDFEEGVQRAATKEVGIPTSASVGGRHKIPNPCANNATS
eukprot:4908220-Amphidinium_carterae.1